MQQEIRKPCTTFWYFILAAVFTGYSLCSGAVQSNREVYSWHPEAPDICILKEGVEALRGVFAVGAAKNWTPLAG